MEITTYIAIYGAILSTIAIVWNIIKDINNRVKVKVTASVGFATWRDGRPTKETYSFEAVNVGKRVVTLNASGIRIENNQEMQFIENCDLPKKLNEGDKVYFFRYMDEFYPEIKDHKPEYLWFRDTKGKYYKSKSVKKLFSIKYHKD